MVFFLGQTADIYQGHIREYWNGVSTIVFGKSTWKMFDLSIRKDYTDTVLGDFIIVCPD